MVKLQRRFAYKYKNKEHYKHVVTIPDEAIDKLGWKAGDEIGQVVQGNKLVLMPIESSDSFSSARLQKPGAKRM